MFPKNRFEQFWAVHAEASGAELYSAEFKDLFQKMMVLHPKKRLEIDEIRAHPWMQGHVPSYEEIKTDFTRRKQLVDYEASCSREEKRNKRRETRNRRTAGLYRCHARDVEDGEEEEGMGAAWQSLEV